jgi:drug/metabolite transporter (DMT)-like permease
LKNETIGILSGLSAASIWGGMYVVSKVVLETIPPFTLITLRLLLGALTLWLWLILRGGARVTAGQFRRVVGVGAIGYGVSLGFQFIGTKLSTAANGSLVTSATPAFVLVFAGLILHERITGLRVLALVLASLGVVAVIDPRTANLDGALFWGNVALLAAALTWALYSVLIRVVSQGLDVVVVTLVAFIGGLPISAPLGAWEASTVGIGAIGISLILGVLFLGIVCTALAMVLWNIAFARLDAGVASLTFFAQPVVGSLLSWVLLHEAITPMFLLGGSLIAAGLVFAAREQ